MHEAGRSRPARAASASSPRRPTAREQLLTNRPGVGCRDAARGAGRDPARRRRGTELLVMELATRQGADDRRHRATAGEIVLGHPKTREAMRAGLAMYFETLDDPALMELADAIVARARDRPLLQHPARRRHVIEINPRISTIVYQEDLNLPYLGVKRALGEISRGRARRRGAAPPDPASAALLRPGRVGRVSGRRARPRLHPRTPHPRLWRNSVMLVEPTGRGVTCLCTGRAEFGTIRERSRRGRSASRTARSTSPGSRGKNVAGAAARSGVDARLVVFNRGRLHPEADESLDLDRRDGFVRAAARRSGAALARLLPRTDVFHFYFGLTLVPKSLQFPLLRATRARSPSSTSSAPTSAARRRPSSPTAARADARDRRLLRRDPLGARRRGGPARASTCADYAPSPAVATRARPLVVHAPSNRATQGHRARDRRVRAAAGRPRRSSRACRTTRRVERYAPRRHRRRPAERRLVRRLRDRGDGARQAGRHASPRRRRSAHRGGVRHRACRS